MKHKRVWGRILLALAVIGVILVSVHNYGNYPKTIISQYDIARCAQNPECDLDALQEMDTGMGWALIQFTSMIIAGCVGLKAVELGALEPYIGGQTPKKSTEEKE